MSEFNLRTCNRAALNTLTKYPSIQTYHILGDRGRLTPEHRPLPPRTLFYASEKVDGTNVRMLFLPDGTVVLGSRENLLWTEGDVFGDPALGIVDGLKDLAFDLNQQRQRSADPNWQAFVLYGEFYGGKIGKFGKQYSSRGETGFRLFDVQLLGHQRWIDWLQTRSLEELASWREGNNQLWCTTSLVTQTAELFGLETVPFLFDVWSHELPETLEDTHAWLQRNLPASRASLDPEAEGKPEGLVIRTGDRDCIYKIRFEDYERTLDAKRNPPQARY